MKNTTFTRRQFAHLLGAGAAAAFVRPGIALGKTMPAGAPGTSTIVRLSSNENPYGPSAKAIKAMTDCFSMANRYPDDHADGVIEAVAKLNSVTADQILLGDGSGEILKLCADTFTGPQAGKLIAADPTFEAILNHASIGGAEVVKVPLTSNFSHDLAAMKTAAKGGLVYICNPNNPTASITPKNDLR